jgi:hypothetical protein
MKSRPKKILRRKNKKFDLFAFAILRSSPEFARWMCGLGKLPSLHSPQNIIRIIDFHVEELNVASAALLKAKMAVHNRQWRDARKFLKGSASKLSDCASYLNSSIGELLNKAARDKSEPAATTQSVMKP